MIKVEGVHGISATVLKHSVCPKGIEFITFEIEYPRLILAELNTHGMLVRNSASSRAIPFAKMKEQLTARPVRFGAANPGMQDKGEAHTTLIEGYTPEEWWRLAGLSALKFAEGFHDAGYHKQVYNRRTEADQMMKTVISGTEWNNFMWLRDHGAADPTIAELARVIKEARALSKPMLLRPGEWHLPYVVVEREDDGSVSYKLVDVHDGGWTSSKYLTLDEAIKVSSARCAAVSFRNVDYGVEKCREVYDRLVGDERKHASAFQHQATPMREHSEVFEQELLPGNLKRLLSEPVATINNPFDPFTWEPGVSHVDRNGQLWSAQLRGWVMQRKLIVGENVPG